MIPVHIHSEDELYNRFDPRKRLSGDLFSYLRTCYGEIPIADRKDCVIELTCDTPIDPLVVTSAVHQAVGREIAELDRQYHFNRLRMIRLYIIGAALIVAGITLAVTLDQFALEILSIVGSMAVKDGATIMIEHNPEMRMKKRLLEQMLKIPVVLAD